MYDIGPGDLFTFGSIQILTRRIIAFAWKASWEARIAPRFPLIFLSTVGLELETKSPTVLHLQQAVRVCATFELAASFSRRRA